MAYCVAFLGPSLSHEEARGIVGDACELRPPVKRGDLPRLQDSVRLVAIIDGVFQSESAVGHREILDLIRKGVEVVGGGSMGALRASELDSMGMLGIGEVYELYAQKRIDGDDEVALIFNPEDLEALSEPLVNMRQNLRRAIEKKAIDTEGADLLLRRMKAKYYPKRSKASLIEEAEKVLGSAWLSKFEKFVREDYVDVKMNDAKAVLRFLINRLEKQEENYKKSSNRKHP